MFGDNANDDLISNLEGLDRETKGFLCVPNEQRQRLLSMLSGAVVARQKLIAHCAALRRLISTPFRHTEQLSDADLYKILIGGLQVLDDSQLARIALNPVALCQLHVWISTHESEAWSNIIDAEGRALISESRRDNSARQAGDNESSVQLSETGAEAHALNSTSSFPPTPIAQALGSGSRRQWTMKKSAGELKWLVGSQALLEDPVGLVTIKAEWDAPRLYVGVYGPLPLGAGCRLEAQWTDLQAAIKAFAETGDVDELIGLEPKDAQPPQPGDRLILRHSKEDVWLVEATLEFKV